MDVKTLLLIANMLLIMILLMMTEQFYPEHWVWIKFLIGLSTVALVLYGVLWALPRRLIKRFAERRQIEKDEARFLEWRKRQTAFDKKYDPEDKWDEFTNRPKEYWAEHRQLRAEYRDIFKRLRESPSLFSDRRELYDDRP